MKSQIKGGAVLVMGLCLAWGTACGREPGSSSISDHPTPRVVVASDKGDRVATGGDLQFMQDAAAGGMMEVDLGRLAERQATSQEVKQFGRKVAEDHSRAGQDLMRLAGQKNVPLSQDPSPVHKETMGKLAKLNGTSFDNAYVAQMVADHVKDVTAFETVEKTATDKDVKDFAARTLPTLKEHLKMIREIAARMNIKS